MLSLMRATSLDEKTTLRFWISFCACSITFPNRRTSCSFTHAMTRNASTTAWRENKERQKDSLKHCARSVVDYPECFPVPPFLTITQRCWISSSTLILVVYFVDVTISICQCRHVTKKANVSK